MGRSWAGVVVAIASLGGGFAAGAWAHPASGIVVDTKGHVFFLHTGHGVCRIACLEVATPDDLGGHAGRSQDEEPA